MLNGIQTLILGIVSFAFYAFLIQKYKDRIGAKYTRKMIHVTNGLTAASVTFLTKPSDYWGAIATAICTTSLLLIIRMISKKKEEYGSCIYTTSKYESIGEILFPVVFLILLPVTKLDFTTYFLPVMILTLSDTAAALIGANVESPVISQKGEGTKTLAGSVSFFLVTALLLSGGLLFTGRTVTWIFLLELLYMSFSLTIIEMTCMHGTDNLLIPLTAYLYLSEEMKSQCRIVFMIGVLFLAIVLVLFLKNKTSFFVIQAFHLWTVGCLSGCSIIAIAGFTVWFLFCIYKRKEKLTVCQTSWFQNAFIISCFLLKIC